MWRRYPGLHALVATAIAALAGLILFLFDPNRYPFYPVCAFHKVTGLLCPGCGSLRAMHQLLHGHLAMAFRFNPFLISTLPILAVYFVICCLRRVRCETTNLAISTKWWWVFLAVALVFTVWRNIPGSPFSTLPDQ